jgi:CBS domain-containing protein
MNVQAILSVKDRGGVISIDPAATLQHAVHKFASYGIGALLVLGPEHRIVGILSERDVIRALAQQGARVLFEPLASVMTRKVVTCAQTDTVSAIMEVMTIGKFRHVPVIAQDRPVGIISIGDVVKHRLHEMDQESSALRHYVQTA